MNLMNARTSFTKLSFVLLFCFLTTGLFSNRKQEIFNFDRMITISNPEKAPPAIPRYLIPQDSKFLLSTDLRTQFYTSVEAFVSFEHSATKPELEKFYSEHMQSREWKLLQSDFKEEKTILLSEGFSRKVITVMIEKTDQGTSKVKIYFKKNSNY
ncbi:MAG: hypothetical protein JJT78_07745 [Leptospira sp.]|nr:hypothetical protein [Leptospira sp.]